MYYRSQDNRAKWNSGGPTNKHYVGRFDSNVSVNYTQGLSKGKATTTDHMPKSTKAGLKEAVGLDSDEEWLEWLQSVMVKPWWLELWNCYLRDRSTKERGPGLSVVQERMVARESQGKMEFSRLDRTGKGQWDEVDHYGCFVYWVNRQNGNSNEGVFFVEQMPDGRRDQVVWALKEHLRYIDTRDKSGRKQEALRSSEQPELLLSNSQPDK